MEIFCSECNIWLKEEKLVSYVEGSKHLHCPHCGTLLARHDVGLEEKEKGGN